MRNKCNKNCTECSSKILRLLGSEYHSWEEDSLHSLRRWPEDKNGMISPYGNDKKPPASQHCVNENQWNMLTFHSTSLHLELFL